jgi:hypothetical protein
MSSPIPPDTPRAVLNVLHRILAMNLADRTALMRALEWQVQPMSETGFTVIPSDMLEIVVSSFEGLAKLTRDNLQITFDIDEQLQAKTQAAEQAISAYRSVIPKPRFADRDAEIVRLRDEILPSGKRRTFGEILNLIKDRWPLQQNGLPLTAKAVASAYRRAKSLRQLEPQ